EVAAGQRNRAVGDAFGGVDRQTAGGADLQLLCGAVEGDGLSRDDATLNSEVRAGGTVYRQHDAARDRANNVEQPAARLDCAQTGDPAGNIQCPKAGEGRASVDNQAAGIVDRSA